MFRIKTLHFIIVLVIGFGFTNNLGVQAQTYEGIINEIDKLSKKIEPQVIEWRRDFHQHPELGNREFRTSKIIAEHLSQLGMEVQTKVAHTGVVGLLKGKKLEPVVALRADMDALPIIESTGLSFASNVKEIEDGKEIGVMHACGHDAHMAMLMGAAVVLEQIRDRIPGSVKFIFQPAEEGTPTGGIEGANLMVKEGALEKPRPSVIFGQHVEPRAHIGTIAYRSGGALASADYLKITVHGEQTHGARPWTGVDPIVVASQIVLGLQTIVSRQIPLVKAPAVITIGSIHGGSRSNVIPDKVEMIGTIRCLDRDMRLDIHDRIKRLSTHIAQSNGAIAEVEITPTVPAVINDPEITAKMLPTIQRVAGEENVEIWAPMTGGEDFAFYLEEIPGLFLWLGVTSLDKDPLSAPFLHTPNFEIDEGGLILGVRILCNLAFDYLTIIEQ